MASEKDLKPIGVLICDDSALVRLFLKSIIEDDPDLRVLGAARNGEEAIELARRLRPDVVTMDIDMPGLDGLSALRVLVRENIAPVIIISSQAEEGADPTLEALEIGAFDFLLKPQGKAYYGQAEQIVGKLKAAARGKAELPYEPVKAADPVFHARPQDAAENSDIPSFCGVAVGASTGGPKALIELVSRLPEGLDAAFFVVQHMPRTFIAPFTRRMASRTKLDCHVAVPGETVVPGTIYVADGDYHLTLSRKNGSGLQIHRDREPRTLFIPSVNVTMQSVAERFRHRGIGVILTGMGNDGAQGIRMIRGAGGYTVAESPKTAVVYGMPQEAVKTGHVAAILPLGEIPEKIARLVGEMSAGVRKTQHETRHD